MRQYTFKEAGAVWCKGAKDNFNQLVGFYTCINQNKSGILRLAIAARSYYRLFINGQFVAAGPARTAERYCRVDEITIPAEGVVHVAVEVLAINKPVHYSNDCTMEPGMLTMEITDENGSVLSFTGSEDWLCAELSYRRMDVELMSHSRGIMEYYDMNPESESWMRGETADFMSPVITENAEYLPRRAPYPDYHKISLKYLMNIGDCLIDQEKDTGTVYRISRFFNKQWYENLSEKNCFQEQILKEKEAPFSGEVDLRDKKGWISVKCKDNPVFFQWGNEKSDLGFIALETEVEEETTVDIINNDCRESNGEVDANTYAVRYHLSPGKYCLLTWEPKLTRYVKVIIRTSGQVRIKEPELLCYTYSDKNECHFECNDGDINRIYGASKRTLRLNTLDIFMDCPQRERGGWLCDSYFTSRGAWQLFGDLSVEKDFIENFMLTDADKLWHAFFPEVYPGCKHDSSDVGITNWSYWLAEELWEFYQRSGDQEFIESCRERITKFAEGVIAARGNSGLLENMPGQFVDWSISNKPFNHEPISVANNCLAVHMLEKLAELYGVNQWKNVAEEMRGILNKIPMNYFSDGDAAIKEDGGIVRQGCKTEGAIALEVWSGFHRDDSDYMKKFVKTMGPCPRFRPDPNIGKANLFIGLMLRLDVLSKIHETETMLHEIKEIYLPQLKDGSGTLFENNNELSGCHGFNGVVGAMLMSDILGLGQPVQKDRTIMIRPNPCGLLWASGSEKCDDGKIFMKWSADYDEHLLDVIVLAPDNWTLKVQIPFELKGWTVTINNKEYQKV